MAQSVSPRQFRERIIGRTISGVIARPGRPGEPPIVMMLRFEDGGVVEFVSPRSDRLLKDALELSVAGLPEWHTLGHLETGSQLPLDGLFRASAAAVSGSGTA